VTGGRGPFCLRNVFCAGGGNLPAPPHPGYTRGMEIILIALAVLAIANAAFCVWLAVRVYNRRERWAKWTLAVAVGVPLIYFLGLGPVMRMTQSAQPGGWPEYLGSVYAYPALQAAYRSESIMLILSKYVQLWMPSEPPDGPRA
jgi:hypothetical protein